MRREDREKRKKFVKNVLYLTIKTVGYFNINCDGFWLFPIVAKTCGCSVFFVKMMWHQIEKENPSFVSENSY